MARQKAGKRTVLTAERRRRALDLRLAGKTYEQIGRQLGITRQSAHELVMGALAEIKRLTNDKAEELLQLELERLDAVIAALWPRRKGHNAANAIVRAIGKRAELRGLEPPAKHVLSNPDGGPVGFAVHLIKPGDPDAGAPQG